MLSHARLNKKFFFYAVKYAQRVHDMITVKDLVDNQGLPTTRYYLLSGSKPNIKQFRVFGCPAVIKKYEFSDKGKRTKDKFSQQGITGNHSDNDVVAEHTGEPTGHIQTFEDLGDSLANHKQKGNTRVLQSTKRDRKSTNDVPVDMITAFLASMSKPTDDSLSFLEYLNVAHKLSEIKKDEDIKTDKHVNLSDFIPEPRILSQILRMSPFIKEKWKDAIRSEVIGLFDNETFFLNENPLPADEIIPAKLSCKTKLNIYGGVDK